MGPQCRPLASLKGSELWAPGLKVVYTGSVSSGFGGIPNLGPIPAASRIYFEDLFAGLPGFRITSVISLDL